MSESISLEEARSPACLLFECVTGSRAYGTEVPGSDTDLRGVFVMPRNQFFGLGRIEQVSDAKNDETYYEVGRFVDLLGKNNPNILEVLFAEPEMIRHRHDLFSLLRPEIVLSRLCEQTFAGYAMTQIRKARGLNKKIVNPMEGPRKSILDFCYLVEGQGSLPLCDWLAREGIDSKDCGLVKIPHMRDVFGIFHEPGDRICYRGMIKSEASTDLVLSSIPKGETPVGWMNFNKDGYKKYCKAYREYQDWLENRNEARFASNISHGKNYDSKNLMHTFRLLSMAEEIAREETVRVRRPDRDFLMKVRAGDFKYDDLIKMAEEKVERVSVAFRRSHLPAEPNRESLLNSLIEIRERFYNCSQ